MANPLFPNYTRAQEDAIRGFRQTPLGRIVANAAASIRRGRTPRDAARQIARDLGQPNQRVRYSRSAGATGDYRPAAQRRAEGDALANVTASLGPQLGGLIGAMVRPNGIPVGGATTQTELAVAAALLEAFGWQVTPAARSTPTAPNERPEWLRPRQTPREYDYRERPDARPESRPVPSRLPAQGYPEDDPVMTGQMVPVRSSNVHSIGFRWNRQEPSKGTLLVRFLDHVGGEKTTAGGATYAYYDVHPKVFQAFRQAASKGRFVWDRLRIRGSVTGHQYAYRLVGLSKTGYVPRQATVAGQNEYFLQRRVTSVSGQVYQSSLPDRLVGTRGEPSRGQRPYRGNRGTPNRGRP